MKKIKNLKRKVPVIIFALLIIVSICAIYIIQLRRTVSSNIIQNITELAEHDESNIENNIESALDQLVSLEEKFASYQYDTIQEMETQMNVESAASSFSHIYMVAEDGKIYTDNFVTYDPSSKGQTGRIDFLSYFENGEERVVERFDENFASAGFVNEGILYGVRLDQFTVEGIRMIALVGISDISSIQDNLTINSFTKNGVSRGYSALINRSGDYIADVERDIYVNENDNFFDRVNNGVKTELTTKEIVAKMENEESFSFSFTNAKGVKRIVYCMPFDESDINWYFLMSVEASVFSDQNRAFLTMSIAMLVSIVFVIMGVVIFILNMQNKVVTANAESRAKTTFLANMSHEIQTPLNGIIGLIFLLEKDIENEENKEIIRQRLEKTKETAEYLLSLLNNILGISKLQIGKTTAKHNIISPDIIVNDIWSMQRSNIESRGIDFVIERNITAPWIIGDDIMMKRVLMNIVSNAAKFTPKGGKITLSVTQEPEADNHVKTIFMCRDTGCGMSEEFLEHIWDRFSQERSMNNESVKGTGLGMAISKLLVNAMGGDITVTSKLGEGSTFCVILHSEISEAPDYTKDINEEYHPLISVDSPMKIMVAEDNELNAEILIEILENEGFEVMHAENGQVAIEQFCESKIGEIGAILMDIRMPVMDGYEATTMIRHMDRPDANKVSIFACTANNFSEDRERAAESGMDDFIAKPIDVHELMKKLGTVWNTQMQS